MVTWPQLILISLLLCPSENSSFMLDSTKIKKWVGGGMKVDFLRNSNVLVQKQKCGISSEVASFLAEAELLNFKSQNILCAEAELQIIVYSLCGSGSVEFLVTVYSLRG